MLLDFNQSSLFIKVFHVQYFQNISKMTSMKVVPIPVIENFANLIVYPSKQKVSNKVNNFQFIYA